MLRRRNKFLENYSCVMCSSNTDETLEHLFFDCPSAAARWYKLGIVWDDEAVMHHKLLIAKNDFPFPFFMEVFMVAAWCLWNERNAVVFSGRTPSLSSWNVAFKKEIEARASI